MTITILKIESFQPLGPAIPKPAPAAPQPVQIKPGIWQAPDGKLFTTTLPDCPQRPEPPLGPKPIWVGVDPASPEAPLPVVPNALGDGWIDCSPDMPDRKAGRYELRNAFSGYCWAPSGDLLDIVVSEFRGDRYQYRLIP